ncbi:flagellin [Thalassospira marina]|uniref:Flagellin n=1 Tax=Thalassospira marina TaxID=2048283 RepID=A0A2N3KZC3_9PROT|nr:flagellin [Thalassospira marina]PKR55922.1 flagellin [Thalassospira marina]
MSLNIISNYAANVAHRNLQASDDMATRSLAKLSSGTRVVSARDDAASMAIGARLNAESQSLKTATVNVGQANSMLQIADGGMATIDNVLVRMKSLAVQASSGNLSDTERGFLDDEYGNLTDEINRISATTKFNNVQLLGSGGGVEVDPTGIGTAVTAAAGVQGLTFSPNSPIAATDTISFDMQAVAGSTILTVSNGTVQQSIDVTQLGAATGTEAIGTGQTKTLNFDQLGIKLTLNENFGTSVDNATANANDWDGDTASDAANATMALRNVSASAALAPVDFQIGSGSTTNDRFTINLSAVDAGTLGTVSGTTALQSTDLTNQANAQAAIDIVGNAINDLQSARANIGVYQNRLDFAAQNLSTTQENTEAARSTLMDLDVASEMTSFSSKQVLVQSGVAMLAQANQMPQNLLRLLQ